MRPAVKADVDVLRRFFRELSHESRYKRFFTAGDPSDAILEQLSDLTDPSRGLTLVVERQIEGERRIIATASYLASNARVAEVAFAVGDAFQGKGLGTALLERLAVAAADVGILRFEATTLLENRQMLEVFRESGFEVRSTAAGGSVEIELSLIPSAGSVSAEEARNRLAVAASVRPLLEPASVAIIGASRDHTSIGRRVLESLVSARFAGPIYPVNPHATEISGLAVLESARDLPAGVDLAVIAVPAPAVPGVVDECAAAGVKSVVVISAGFAEAGSEGRALQDQLVEKVRGYGMRMVGPNCMGLLNANPQVRLNASFSPIFPPAGCVGLLSQSGALGLAILELATERHLGFSTFVSIGNKADVSGNDLLEYWDADPSTSVILLYLESFGNPRRFARLARRIGRQKPIVAVKSGRTRAGARAASSHTAALAVSDVAVDALFRQTGVVRAETLDEMFDLAVCLASQPLPAGPRVAIVTNAGGPAILAADACEGAGLTLAELSEQTRARLSACLPSFASCRNPVDMIASAGPAEYRRTIETMLTAAEVDSVIVIFTPVDARGADTILRGIRDGVADGRRAGSSAKPVVSCVMSKLGQALPVEPGSEQLPTYVFPENAARALGKITSYAQWRERDQGLLWGFDDMQAAEARTVCRTALEGRGEGWLSHEEIARVLAAFGLPAATGTVAHSEDEAAALATAMKFPVAAKLSSNRIIHKSDIGAVKLNLVDAPAVRSAYKQILAASRAAASSDTADAVLIQPMITGGVETMVGVTQDPVFGPLVAFGLGGIYVEILKDVVFRIAPLTDRDVHELLHGIKGFPLLEGYRGHPPADMDALRELLFRVSSLAKEIPEIGELDLNPVIALPPGHGCHIVDARIRVKPTAVSTDRRRR